MSLSLDVFEQRLEDILSPIQSYAALLQDSRSDFAPFVGDVLESLHNDAQENLKKLTEELKEQLAVQEALNQCPEQVVIVNEAPA